MSEVSERTVQEQEVVTVTPVAGREGAALGQFQTAHEVELIDPTGQHERVSQSLGERKGTFIDAINGRKPIFDKEKGYFVFVRSDGSEYTQEDFDKLVDLILAYFPDTHPEAGKRITYCNMQNSLDPYLNNDIWKYSLEEGTMTVSGPSSEIGPRVDLLRGDPEMTMAVPGDPLPGDKKFRIESQMNKAKSEAKQAAQTDTALDLYISMRADRDRLRDTLILMGYNPAEDEPLGKMQKIAQSVIQDTSREGGITRQAMFIKYGSLTPEDRKKRVILTLAVASDLVKFRGGIYEYAGEHLGSSFDTVIDWFSKNVHQLDALEMQVKKIA